MIKCIVASRRWSWEGAFWYLG